MVSTAFSVYASKGAVNYPLGFALFIGCLIGSTLGAH